MSRVVCRDMRQCTCDSTNYNHPHLLSVGHTSVTVSKALHAWSHLPGSTTSWCKCSYPPYLRDKQTEIQRGQVIFPRSFNWIELRYVWIQNLCSCKCCEDSAMGNLTGGQGLLECLLEEDDIWSRLWRTRSKGWIPQEFGAGVQWEQFEWRNRWGVGVNGGSDSVWLECGKGSDKMEIQLASIPCSVFFPPCSSINPLLLAWGG